MRYIAFQETEFTFPRGHARESEFSCHKGYNGHNGLVGVTRSLTSLLSLCECHGKTQTTSLSLALCRLCPLYLLCALYL